jgi:aspartyl/asparaginyl beta-hydroxylase (cupin superfamily)
VFTGLSIFCLFSHQTYTYEYVFPELQQLTSQYYSFNNLNLLKMEFLRNKIIAEENKIKQHYPQSHKKNPILGIFFPYRLEM